MAGNRFGHLPAEVIATDSDIVAFVHQMAHLRRNLATEVVVGNIEILKFGQFVHLYRDVPMQIVASALEFA